MITFDEIRRRAIEQCRRTYGRRDLASLLKFEAAMARLWHIETGRPLPPALVRQSQPFQTTDPLEFRRAERELHDAWLATGKLEVCLAEIRPDPPGRA